MTQTIVLIAVILGSSGLRRGSVAAQWLIKRHSTSLFLLLFLCGCTQSHYYLDDTNQDKRFLVEKIEEFTKKGMTTNKPILVIDGIEFVDTKKVDLKRMGISKSDIKSIDLLKKEAALRVFGKEGERGVLLITTKKPKNKG